MATDTFAPSSPEWVAVGVVVLTCLATIVIASWRTVRLPLLRQLERRQRPARPTPAGLFVQVLVVIAAVVAIYQARHTQPLDRSGGEWVSLLSPALAGLAAGQLLVWALQLGATWATRRRTRSIGWFLATRRLARRADGSTVVRLVVAAVVLVAVAVGAFVAGGQWRDQARRLSIGAPVSYPAQAGGLQAYVASHRADPEGRWLMAAVAFPSTPGYSRRVFVDMARWDRVSGAFLAGTDAGRVSDLVETLPTASSVPHGVGRWLRVTMPAHSVPEGAGLDVVLKYVNDRGNVDFASVTLSAKHGEPVGAGRMRFAAQVADCARSCSPISLRVAISGGPLVGSRAFKQVHPVHTRVSSIRFAGLDLLSSVGLDPGKAMRAQRHRAGLNLQVRTYSQTVLGTWRVRHPLPVITASHTNLQRSSSPFPDFGVTERGHRFVRGPDGHPIPVSVVGSVPALPLVGTSGTLLDLSTALRGAANSIPGATAYVLARADTPPSVVQALHDSGVVGAPHRFPRVGPGSAQDASTWRGAVYVVVAGCAGLIAVISMVSSFVRRAGERRFEAAGMRSAGVGPKHLQRGDRRESVILAAAVCIAGSVAAWVASDALLQTLPLVQRGPFQPFLSGQPSPIIVAGVAVAGGLLTAAVELLAFRSVPASSRPSHLRHLEEQ